jgi:hypothetical protein
MAQGAVKSKPKPSAAKKGPSHHSTKGVTKKGSLQMNPRKQQLQKQAKMNKKFTSGLTAQTEKMLGAKAGHLELIGKGRSKGEGGKEGKGKDGKKGK